MSGRGESLLTETGLWWLFVLVGIVMLGVGIFFVASPHETLKTFTVIAGILLLVDGVLAVVRSVFGELENRGLLALTGVISAVAGLILIKKPFGTLIVLTLILGVWFVVVGGVRFVAALALREDRGANIAIALIDVIVGIVILAWPEIGLATLAIIFGIGLIIHGLLLTWAGFQLRSLPSGLPGATVPPT
jgi:uncharacterized membrane protein HdeD (DUF308 family)